MNVRPVVGRNWQLTSRPTVIHNADAWIKAFNNAKGFRVFKRIRRLHARPS